MTTRLFVTLSSLILIASLIVWASGCGSPSQVQAPGFAGIGQPSYSRGIPESEIQNFPTDWSKVPAPTLGSGFASAMNLSDELWIITKPQTAPDTEGEDDFPGSGALVVRNEPQGEGPSPEITEIPIPLEHTAVETTIDAYIASVRVTQRFANPFDEKIEAVYVFPLPQDAAVDGFVMTIGDRKIRGIIREREEAERIYADAKRQGYRAALMTQDRPNIFTQSVANIEPGKSIDVDITYFHTLPYRDGWFEYVFPMVVGPRYNPPHTRDGVGAVARGQSGASNQKTELQYLRPTERTGHDISLNINLDAGVSIEAVDSPTHDVAITRDDPTSATITLSQSDSIPNRDFILRYRVSGSDVKSVVLTHADPKHIEDGGFFSMLIVPPDDLSQLARNPVEVVFVLDCSGSMRGRPLEQAKQAASHALSLLGPDDTFRVIRFSDQNDSMRTPDGDAIPASRANIRRGLRYIENLEAGGSTVMIRGVEAALRPRPDRDRRRIVVFMTDGFIGNETDILAAIEKHIGSGSDSARIFSFGVGSSVNRYLMERMAKLGQGAVAYISLGDDPRSAMDLFLERTSHPALEHVKIDFGAMKADGVYPSSLPDLFVGRPVVVTGRYQGDAQLVTLRGRAGSSDLSFDVPVIHGKPRPALASVWARKRIEDLADRSHAGGNAKRDRLTGEITETALEFGLMSAFTSFIAVDALEKTEGLFGGTVETPVHVPEGVEYSKTVSGG